MAAIRKRSWISGGETKTAWVADYTDQGGTRRLKTFKTKKEADGWLVQARHQVASGTHTADSTSITIAEAADLWLEHCEDEQLERSTMSQYRGHVRLHIKPLLGDMKLSRLTTPMVEQFVDWMLAKGHSRPLAKAVLISLKAIIAEAQRRGLVAQNVATGVQVKLAKRHEQKVEIPSKAEIKTLLEGVTGRERPLLITAVFTGLRASELRGLPWADLTSPRA